MSRLVRTAPLRSVAATGAALLLSLALPAATRVLAGPPSLRLPTPAAPAASATPDVARRSIERREYEARDAGAGLQAPNRANGLRTYFDASGARVVDRVDGTQIARLGTISIGRGSEAQPVPHGEVSASGARVEVRRAGLVEWFENTSAGLEHGWTLEARPEGDGPLAIEVDVDGARLRVDGGRATIAGGGRRLEYGGLEAVDAGGRAVAVHLEATAATGRMRIVVDDAEASYPLTIDPTLTSPGPAGPPSAGPATLPDADVVLQSDQAGSAFGISVAGAGDVNGDGYDDCIVGAYSYDSGEGNEGAAFVFHGGPGGVADGSPANADAVLQSDQVGASLGVSVAGAGDVNGDGFDDCIVGAQDYDRGQMNEGAAFVFLGGPAGIGDHGAEDADAILESNQTGGTFGQVAGAGDVNGDGFDDVVVGAYSYSADGSRDRYGAAFVFHGGPVGVGDGSPANADGRLEGDLIGGLFGNSVAGAGDVNGDGFDDVVVGAQNYAGVDTFGAAFVFHGGPVGVGTHEAAAANAVLMSDQDSAFGQSVAGAGDVNGDGFDDCIVGDSIYVANNMSVGAAFVFHGTSVGVGGGGPITAAAVLLGNAESGHFGQSVAGAGDVNGDGFDEVIVGSPDRFVGGQFLGGAFVFDGGGAGVGNGGPANADTKYQSDQGSTAFGTSVAGVGDTNGDFSADVAVGALNYSLGQSQEGAVFLFVGPVLAVGSGADTPAVYTPASGAWFLKNSNAPGPADRTFTYGAAASGLVPIRGDWDGDSFDTPGLYDPATSAFFLKNSNAPGPADLVFTFGVAGAVYVPISGDWDNNGTDTVGLYQPASGTFFLANVNAPGPAASAFGFGPAVAGLVPIAGDWDDTGTDTVGLYAPTTSTFFLKNVNAAGPADIAFGFGAAGGAYRPLAGDYDGDGRDTIGLYDPASGTFFLKNANAPGPAALVFGYGPTGSTPLVGDWNAL